VAVGHAEERDEDAGSGCYLAQASLDCANLELLPLEPNGVCGVGAGGQLELASIVVGKVSDKAGRKSSGHAGALESSLNLHVPLGALCIIGLLLRWSHGVDPGHVALSLGVSEQHPLFVEASDVQIPRVFGQFHEQEGSLLIRQCQNAEGTGRIGISLARKGRAGRTASRVARHFWRV